MYFSFVSFVSVSLFVILSKAEIDNLRLRKTIMLVGVTGVGKSTIANCLLNQRGDLDSIEKGFNTSSNAAACTVNFTIRSNDNFTIIDSIGFGAPDLSASKILQEMRNTLRQVNNRVDLVLFVIKWPRLCNVTRQFIMTFQKDVLQNKARLNSALIVNHCDKPGWILKPEQQDNIYL